MRTYKTEDIVYPTTLKRILLLQYSPISKKFWIFYVHCFCYKPIYILCLDTYKS